MVGHPSRRRQAPRENPSRIPPNPPTGPHAPPTGHNANRVAWRVAGIGGERLGLRVELRIRRPWVQILPGAPPFLRQDAGCRVLSLVLRRSKTAACRPFCLPPLCEHALSCAMMHDDERSRRRGHLPTRRPPLHRCPCVRDARAATARGHGRMHHRTSGRHLAGDRWPLMSVEVPSTAAEARLEPSMS